MPPNLAILGTGLIGASIGLRARERGYVTTGWDADGAHLARALERGALDRAASSGGEALVDADVIVLAIPLEATLEALRAFVAAPPRAGLMLSVAGLMAPCAEAGRALGGFVASHPFAGKEHSGPDAAEASLFVGRRWAFDRNAPAEPVAAARAFVEAMGAEALAIEPERHDRIAALTSQLPQLIGVALSAHLAERLHEPDVYELCGPGIRSTARLGASPWPMWAAVLQRNARPLAQEVRAASAILTEIAVALERGDAPALESRFASAAQAVERLS